MTLPYYVIDAFAAKPFSGNPAAVVLDARGLSDEHMQAIATEFNLSETTFVFPLLEDGGDTQQNPSTKERPAYRFRWFTPTAEVNMCGHATIAAVHALVETGHALRGWSPIVPESRLWRSVVYGGVGSCGSGSRNHDGADTGGEKAGKGLYRSHGGD